MTPRSHILGMMAFLLLAASQGAQADNHIFYNGAPMLSVGPRGAITPLDIGEERPSGERRVKPALARAIKRLYAPGDEVGMPVRRLVLDPGQGCIMPDAVELAGEASTDGVLSTKPLKAPWRAGRTPANEAQKQQALQALEAALKKNKSINSIWRAQLLKQALVEALQLDGSMQPSLVVETEVEKAADRRNVSVLLILTPDANGHLIPTLSDVRAGGVSDSDNYAGRLSLINHADLDGDGQEEVFVSETGYESASIKVYQRSGKSWTEIVNGAASGC